MNELLNINKIWIEFISDSPSNDKYCNRLWKTFKWEITSDYDNKDEYTIYTIYKFGGTSDKMQTWTEPFGTSQRFYKWCQDAKNYLQSKFPEQKIKCLKQKKCIGSNSIYFKIMKKE